MAQSDGRRGRPWERARRNAIGSAFTTGRTTCPRCKGAMDPDGTWPARHPLSLSVDHITPLSRGGRGNDPANLRVMHYGCNSARGDGTRVRVQRTW